MSEQTDISPFLTVDELASFQFEGNWGDHVLRATYVNGRKDLHAVLGSSFSVDADALLLDPEVVLVDVFSRYPLSFLARKTREGVLQLSDICPQKSWPVRKRTA
ncbi:MAG: hypothetical protein V2A63_00245 [Patescibacteria group bacterium]